MRVTRRRFLQAGSIATVGSVAGCLGENVSEQVETLSAPVKGQTDAPITVQSFEDFTCIHCKRFTLEVLPEIESAYIEPGSIQFVRHDYPFLDPEWSWKTANAARAVQDTQGDAAFFEYVDLLYENFDSYSLKLFSTLAEIVGADPQTVREAASDGHYQSTLESEVTLGEEKGVQGTPTVFVNGEMAPSYFYDDIAETIEAQL